MIDYIFYFFSFIILLSVVGVIFHKGAVGSVLSLIVAFIGTGSLFIISGAELIAMILVIVYVGAIAVLFLFVVMMLGCNTNESYKFDWYSLLSFICIASVACLLVFGVEMSDVTLYEIAERKLSTVQDIGKVVYTDRFFIFQISGYILLGAMIGANFFNFRKERCYQKTECF